MKQQDLKSLSEWRYGGVHQVIGLSHCTLPDSNHGELDNASLLASRQSKRLRPSQALSLVDPMSSPFLSCFDSVEPASWPYRNDSGRFLGARKVDARGPPSGSSDKYARPQARKCCRHLKNPGIHRARNQQIHSGKATASLQSTRLFPLPTLYQTRRPPSPLDRHRQRHNWVETLAIREMLK